MRTVISHFYNEAYLLPWWLKHHREIFDHGIMINHGSTDGSLDIVRELVPGWHIVNSTLTNFNAYMTDFEVMTYERDLPGWKIALGTTEFLMCTVNFSDLQKQLEAEGRMGVSCSGYIIVDEANATDPVDQVPLVKQRHIGYNDNSHISPETRMIIQGSSFPSRNRFFHRLPVGMYHPGRHFSFHPESNNRLLDLVLFHYAWAPWTPQGIARKLGISARVDMADIQRGWGNHHMRNLDELENARRAAHALSYDLSREDSVRLALSKVKSQY